MPRSVLARFAALAALVSVSLTTTLGARTLTSSDGRTMEAEVLGFEGANKEKVRIKRAADGQVFTLPIDSFAEADAKALREEAAKPPPPPKEGDIVVQFSKYTLDTRKTKRSVDYYDGTKAGEEVTTDTDTGYAVTLVNRTGQAIENLRAECLLYVEVDVPKGSDVKARKRRESGGTVKFETLAANGRVSARTESVTLRKVELKGNVKWSGSGDSRTRDTLEGIWLRLYQGEVLVLETAMPNTLLLDESWPAKMPDRNAGVRVGD